MLSKESASTPATWSQGPPTTVDPVAGSWHTGALIALMVGVASTGFLLDRYGVARAPAASGRIAGAYLPMLLVQWGMFFYVSRAGRGWRALRALLGPRWAARDGFARDLGGAVVVALLIETSELAFARCGIAGSEALRTILPRSDLERLVWVLVALSAGICEEVVYRGYLQVQLLAFTGKPWVAVALQSALFAIAHGEQGIGTVGRFGLYGFALGVLARRRRTLLPGMVCHVGIDLVGGLLSR